MMEESLAIHHPGANPDQYTGYRKEYQQAYQQQPQVSCFPQIEKRILMGTHFDPVLPTASTSTEL
jgi:hypothetical protein